MWRYIDPNEYTEVYSQKFSSYFDNIYIRGCKPSAVFSALEFTTDGIMALVFLYCSYSAKNCANEFNDSLSLFLTSIIVNILFFNRVIYEIDFFNFFFFFFLPILTTVLIVLDYNINSEPQSALIFRGIGTQIVVIIIVMLQYGYIFFIIIIYYFLLLFVL